MDDDDEIMEIESSEIDEESVVKPSGSRANSPARSIQHSPRQHSAPISSPKILAKSPIKSPAKSPVVAAGPSKPPSPTRQPPLVQKSPVKSPSKASKMSSPAHSDAEDVFQFLEFPKTSPQAKAASSIPSRNKEEARIATAEEPAIHQVSSHPDRLVWEQQAQVFENQLVDLSSQLKTLQGEKKVLVDKFSKQSQDAAAMKKRLQEKEAALEKVLAEKQTSSLKSVQLDHDRQALTSSLLNKDQEIERLTEDLSKSTSKVFELKQELRVEKEKVSDIQANELSLKSTLASNEHELAQAVKMSAWLNTELETKSNEFMAYRKEKARNIEQIKSLQSGLEESAQEKNGLEVRASLLQKRVDDLESKLSSKMDSLQEAENSRIMSEQQFKNEMTAQKKLTDLYLGKSQELSTHNQELESLVRELEGKVLELSKSKEDSAREFQDQLAAQKALQDKQEVELEQLRSQIKLINTDMTLENQAEQVAQLSQTAAAASRFQKTGKSFTQVYSDYTALQQDYIREKSEVARLNECLNHIVAEFEQRAPIIQKTNEEYQKARDQIENMSIELSNAVREKTEAVAQFKRIKAAMEEVEAAQTLLEKDIDDRNRQLQAVLREHEILKGAHPSSLPQLEEEDFSNLSGADAIISKRLVVFRNIEELQTQNQALLRSIRSLSAKMESQERSNVAQADEARLEALTESTKLIERLQEQLKRETLNSESFAKERDQWRRIAETRGTRQTSPGHTTPAPSPEPRKSGGPDYESFYRDLQREFDVYRKESGTDSKLLKSQLERSQEEKTELTIQVAKLNNQIGYLNERHELLLQSTQSKEKEASQLRERLSSINETATRQDIKIEELANSLLQARQSIEAVSAENQQFKIERQIWKSSESRVLKESQDLLKERNAANDRIRELQDALDESDRKAGTKLKRLEDQIEELNRDLQLSRKQLADVLDDHRTLSAKRDAELRESQIKMERMTIDFERAKGELALAINKEQNASVRAQELSAKITALEQKSLIYDGRSRGRDSAEGGAEGELSDLQSELRQVNIELVAAKAELVVAKDQADAFKVISQASEDRLAEMNGTYEIYKLEMEQKISDMTSVVENLEADKADMQTKLSKVGESLRETQESMDAQLETFNSSKSLFERQISALKENEEAANKAVAAMKLDVTRQVKEARNYQTKYEQEVLNHSVSLQSVATLKASIETISQARDDAILSLRSSAEKLASVESTFESVKAKLEGDIVDLENRVEDLKTQNSLLHSQFEQLSLSRAQFSSESELHPEGGEEGQVSSKAVADLGEVIKFLRREKEIVETKLQISVQESERSRLHLDQLQKSLDESRALLDEERRKSHEMLGSERKHAELLEKIEQTNILRESNITLRSQLESSQKKLDELDKKLKDTEVQLEPLKGHVSQLESEVEARKAEGKSLLEDNARWKDRAQQILEKYNRIDPVEHENLKSSVSALTASKEQLEAQLASYQTDIGSQVAEKEARIKALEADIISLKQEHQQAMEEKENELVGLRDPQTNEQILTLVQDLQAAKAKNKKIGKEANEKLKAKNAKIAELQNEIEALKATQAEVDSLLAARVQEAETRIGSEKQAAVKQVSDSLERRYQSQIKSLQSNLLSLQTELRESAKSLSLTATTSQPSSNSHPGPVQTPTPKRTREPDTDVKSPSAPQSGSPHAKRLRVEEQVAPAAVADEEMETEQQFIVEEEENIPAAVDTTAEMEKDDVYDDQEQDNGNEDLINEDQEGEEEHYEDGENYDEGPEESAEELDEDLNEEVIAAEAEAIVNPIQPEEDDDMINIGTPDATYEPADPDAAVEERAPTTTEVVLLDTATPVQENPKATEPLVKSPLHQQVETVPATTAAAPINLPADVVVKPAAKIVIKPPPVAAAVPPSTTSAPPAKVSIQRPKITPTSSEAPSLPASTSAAPSSLAEQLKEKLLRDKLLKEKLAVEKGKQPQVSAGRGQAPRGGKPAVGRINRTINAAGATAAAANAAGQCGAQRGGRGGITIRGGGRGGRGRGQHQQQQ